MSATSPSTPSPTHRPPWWRNALCYQVYPSSFADGDGDGTGDIAGIRGRLEHLVDLGVDAIWISPWYPSPWRDGGYDVADYRSIDPRFGDLDGATSLISEAAACGIGVIVDIVPNHTSTQHPWFQAALDSPPGSPERQRYHFRRGRGADGGQPPNNWTSVFGGPAWRAVGDGDWYLHVFDSGQADLNWASREVRNEFADILRFWIGLGVAGFRFDVAHGLAKDPDYPDIETNAAILSSNSIVDDPLWDRDEVHEVIREWRAVLDESDRDLVMVAEAWVPADRLPLYLRPDEFHQSFAFDLVHAGWSHEAFERSISEALTGAASVGSIPTWTLSNHDVMRHATRYGLPPDTDVRRWLLDGPHDQLDDAAGRRRARAAALLVMALPGSLYLYQGEELGLPEVWDLPLDALRDPAWENSGRSVKGRDGCRVPLPWTRTGTSFGFGSNGSWLPQPPTFGELSVEAQADDPDSTLSLYRRAVALRRRWMCSDEELEWLDLGPEVLAFRRGSGAISVTNFGRAPIELPDEPLALASAPLADGRLPADTTAWFTPSTR
jgi:alpha-glucosidase